ncbi:MAG: class I tRNA ligase family protein, partial [Gaiellales bacterium]
DGTLRMTHPIMPFVTEAIWEHLPGERGLLMLAAFPEPNPARRDADATAHMNAHIEQVRESRRAAQEAAETAAREDGGQTSESRLAHARAEFERAQRMLANERFLAKAPPEKVEEERAKAERWAAEIETLTASQ